MWFLFIGRCVHSFHVLVINSTCVSLSWSLLDSSSVPLFMVVQWLPQRQQDSDLYKGQNEETWVRLPYTDPPVYLRGNVFSSLSVLLLFTSIVFIKLKSNLKLTFDASCQVISLALRNLASSCTLCLLMEKGRQYML